MCTPETNITLYANYASFKKKELTIGEWTLKEQLFNELRIKNN